MENNSKLWPHSNYWVDNNMGTFGRRLAFEGLDFNLQSLNEFKTGVILAEALENARAKRDLVLKNLPIERPEYPVFAEPTDQPTMLLVAGANGSGKTTLVETLFSNHLLAGFNIVNADYIAQKDFGGWNDSGSFVRASIMADKMRRYCFENELSFCAETVYSSAHSERIINDAKEHGFLVHLIYIGTTKPEINLARIRQRVLEGGHDVPEDKVRARYIRSMENARVGLRLADQGWLIDNSRQMFAPRMLARTRNGKVTDYWRPTKPWGDAVLDGLR